MTTFKAIVRSHTDVEILVNGAPLRVAGYRIQHHVDTLLPVVTLELLPESIEIEYPDVVLDAVRYGERHNATAGDEDDDWADLLTGEALALLDQSLSSDPMKPSALRYDGTSLPRNRVPTAAERKAWLSRAHVEQAAAPEVPTQDEMEELATAYDAVPVAERLSIVRALGLCSSHESWHAADDERRRKELDGTVMRRALRHNAVTALRDAVREALMRRAEDAAFAATTRELE